MIDEEKIELEEEKEPTPQEELEILAGEIQQEEKLFSRKTREFLKRTAKKEKIPKEEEELHVQHRKQINDLQKCYASLYKVVYPKGTKNKGSDALIIPLKSVKDTPSSIGKIVTTIPVHPQEKKEANG